MSYEKEILNGKLKRRLTVQLALIIAVSICCFGCGVKAPPVPPRQAPVPEVKDLSSIIDGDKAVLSWAVPDKPGDKNSLIKSFVVYRAKQKISEGDCKNCPVKFTPAAEIQADLKPESKKMKYSESLEKGFKYIFKVTSKSATGAESRDSNFVELSF
jgi:hypothetical protein